MHAIILKKIPIKECDELVVCYTKEFGKATYLAKSIQKHTSKQAAHLDVLNLVDFNLVHRRGSLAHAHIGNDGGTSIITSACSLNNFLDLKNSLPAMAVAGFILEVFNKFVFEGDADTKLWEFLYGKLNHFDQIAGDASVVWPNVLNGVYDDVLDVLGFDKTIDLEAVIGERLTSLNFARQMVK